MMNLCDTLEFKQLKARKKKLVQDLIDGTQHKKGCHCTLCLWREAKEKRPGRPYDFLTFLIPDLIRDLKFIHLRLKGKEELNFGTLAALKDIDLYEALEEILEELPDFKGFSIAEKKTYIEANLLDYLTHSRFKRTLSKLDEFDSRITERNEKKKRGRPKKHPLILLKQMREFIESYQKEEGKAVPKRILQRQFHLTKKEFDNDITFLKYLTKLKSKTGKQKNQILFFY
jgi:hypothetical protein